MGSDSIPEKPKLPVVVIAGPTAAGKTAIAMEVHDQFPPAEIVSADSRQVFRFMDIGTAKPTPDELERHPHYFIDIKNPDEYFSAGEYGRLARKMCYEIASRGNVPLIVGGSGLYIRALIDGLFEGGGRDRSVKKHLEKRADGEGVAVLYQELKSVDKESAGKIHPNDRQRIIRSLEVWFTNGFPISEAFKKSSTVSPFSPLMVGISRPRQHLYEKIDLRVDQMIKSGLIKEVMDLREKGYHQDMLSQRTVGYQEIHKYLETGSKIDEAVDSIKKNTRHFAKRQLTWFRRDQRVKWFDMEAAGALESARTFLLDELGKAKKKIEQMLTADERYFE